MESYLELCNYYYNKYKDSIKKNDYNYTVSYRIIYTYDKEKNVVIGIAYHINNKNEYEFSNIYIFLRNKKCITRLEGSGSVYELSAKSICEILDIECFNNSNYLRPFSELFGEYVFFKGSVPHKTNDLKSLKSFYKNKEERRCELCGEFTSVVLQDLILQVYLILIVRKRRPKKNVKN